MPGPVPKDSRIRQRRNKVATRAGMIVEKAPRQRAPRLPNDRQWHPLTRTWWRQVWASPMAEEYLDADLGGLFILADLVDRYWREPSKELAAEIRLQRQCYGLTPIDRRRLQWEVQRVDPEARPVQRRLVEEERPEEREDPRRILQFPRDARERTG